MTENKSFSITLYQPQSRKKCFSLRANMIKIFMLDKNVDQNKTLAKKLGENYFGKL